MPALLSWHARRPCRSALAFLTFTAFTASARADDPPRAQVTDAATLARERYAAGQRAFAAGRFFEAALYLEAAANEIAHALTIYAAAQAWESSNQPDRAADDLTRAIGTPGLPARELALAKEKLAQLQSVLGRVDVTPPDDAAGGGQPRAWFVQLDANSEQAAPAQLHATPGMHTLSIRSTGRPLERRSIVLALGQVQKVQLSAAAPEGDGPKADTRPPPPPVVVPTPTTPTGVEVRRTIGLVTIGFGAAVLTSGAILGLQALDARDAYNATPSRGGFDHADSLQNWTNIAFVTGGILAAGGLALVLWPHKSATAETGISVSPSLGGAMLRGAF